MRCRKNKLKIISPIIYCVRSAAVLLVAITVANGPVNATTPSVKQHLDLVTSGAALWQSFDSLSELKSIPLSIRANLGACEWLDSIKSELTLLTQDQRNCGATAKTADDMIMIIDDFTSPSYCSGRHLIYSATQVNTAQIFAENFVKTVNELKAKIQLTPIECISDLAPLLE